MGFYYTEQMGMLNQSLNTTFLISGCIVNDQCHTKNVFGFCYFSIKTYDVGTC